MKTKSSFLVAFRVLTPERRRAIEAVYGFCRRADDSVDEAPDSQRAAANLARAATELQAAFRGDSRDSGARGGAPAELVDAIDRFALPRAPFELLLEGVRWDLEGRRYVNREELREYCRRVAGSVGQLCVRIFGCRDPRCDLYADELGAALQWTNILRDIGTDYARGRVYLPQSVLDQHGLSSRDLGRPAAEVRERLSALVRTEAAYARACFAAAEQALPPAERERVLAGRIMAAVYQSLLRRIEWAGAAVLERPIQLSAAARAGVAARVVARERARAWAGGGV